jgi:hypothetical protein
MNPLRLARLMAVFVLASALLGPLPSANADHAWIYHWARIEKRFTLMLGSNVSPEWDTELSVAAEDWSRSKVLDLVIVPGEVNPQACLDQFTPGRVEVCSLNHGRVVWVGHARVWVNGEHILGGVAVLNDYYFTRWPITFNQAQRNMAMCHEIAHTLGLDHRDEDFNNVPLGSCMDYSRDAELNQHPDRHDYEQLELIYGHADTFTSVDSGSGDGAAELTGAELLTPEDLGRLVETRGDEEVYVRELGGGHKVITYVLLAPRELR